MGRRRRVRRRNHLRLGRVGFALAIAAVVAGGAWLWLRTRGLPEPPLTPPRFVSRRHFASRAPEVPGPEAGGSRATGHATDDRGGSDDASGEVAQPPAGDRQSRTPRLAVVIDDLGESLAVARTVLALEPPVTIAVIPFTADARAVAAAAVESGREVILHLPLEPEGRAAMGGAPGFLETGMSAEALDRKLERDLRAVPYIVGVNGHMGSRFTSDEQAMTMLLAALRERGLFFLDSRTSAQSVAAPIAARLGVAFAERSVFLDHQATAEEVERQLARAVTIAKRDGSAIAIGHPHASTIAVLRRRLAAVERQDVRVVPASLLAR